MGRKFSKPVLIIAEVLLFIYAVSLIFPYIWVFINSFKSVPEFYSGTWSLPESFSLTNYIRALEETNMLSYFKVSIIVTLVGTALQLIFSAMTAYILAKYKFKGNAFIYSCAVAGFLIPTTGTLAPLYVFLKNTGLFNIYGLIIMYATGMGTNMVIYYSFFKKISWSYAEAAFIDGAGHFRVFWNIMLPMAREASIAVGITTAIRIWNDYFLPSILLTNPKLQTVAVGLRTLQVQQQYNATWTVLFAAVILASFPTILIYVLFQDRISKGFLMGGLKE
ncbi:carbohydrate ABC transporter permease [Tepidimicrobium xylanilyticum]|uniref:carbohydrate ABC transporter permease n=1 Tax=Tepidimicrobium xylanilyticum TaxID=1123352 RepID=UPI0026503271|nr:carbohydrate ABC transporter permease [Tepidimicrobium xylanilyticum]GMG97025.1 sugar ABC transporter permease [Tepidimicrobium xylanilyticum]